MTKIVIESNVGGTGVLTVYAPTTSNTATINLPTSSGDLLTTGSTGLNANNITTGILAVANGGTGINSTGTAGNVLTSDGSAWVSQAVGGGFTAGTVMLFGQTSAPTGWTKDTTNYDNSALRVVTGSAGTGGSVDFTTAFSSQSITGTIGSTTLSTSEIPSHSHQLAQTVYYSGLNTSTLGKGDGSSVPQTYSTNNTGGGGSHTHSLSGGSLNLAVKYVDVIRATKD